MLVARSLGATLVIPDIRGSQPGDKRLVIVSPISISAIVEEIGGGGNFASFFRIVIIVLHFCLLVLLSTVIDAHLILSATKTSLVFPIGC